MNTINIVSKALLGTFAAGVMVFAHAQTLSQTPLLTQSVPVKPNLLIHLDDSGSMFYGFLYEYGGSQDYRGNTGPSVATYAAYSPDINRVYYDPRLLYSRRVNADGSFQANGNKDAYVVDQDCDPQGGSSSKCLNSNAPEQSTTGTYKIEVYFAKPNGVTGSGLGSDGSFTTTSVNAKTAYYSDSYTPTSGELAPGATILPYPNVMTWDRTTTLGVAKNITYNGGTSQTASTAVYPAFKARTDCKINTLPTTPPTIISCTWEEERQNHANWLAYHSNRMRVATTGFALAFQPLPVTDATASPATESTFRLGWATMSGLDGSSKLTAGVKDWTPAVRTAFLDWLYWFETNTTPRGTPTLTAVDRAGVYFTRKDSNGPWGTTPNGSTALTATGTDSSALSCRRSYQLLLTDGYYNSSSVSSTSSSPLASGSPGNVDNTTQPTPPRKAGSALPTWTYTPAYPYKDTASSTFADIALKYWVTDLRPDIDNSVSVVTGTQPNESYWQNLTFYAIGFGVKGTLTQDTATFNNLAAGSTLWPSPVAAKTTTIDDMWHATINGRGQLLNATNTDSLKTAIDGMMARVTAVTDSQSGVAASTLSLSTGTTKYTPRYTTGSWIGNVTQTKLDAASGAELCTQWKVTGSIESTLDKPSCTTTTSWSGIPAHGTRKIYAWDGSTFGDFNEPNTYVSANVVGASTNLINYLRGDQTNETPNGTKEYRAREVVLGDIVNSTPTFIQGALDMSYENLPTATYGQSTYKTFIATKTARSPGVLFAGANDGMLHGFNGNTGAEVFAFVPRAVMPKMHLLASQTYSHNYYVDGPTVEADACLTGGSACTVWTNLLLGTAGAGAKTVFALDVTTPMSMTAASVKWEITTATTGYANLGHVLTDVQTGLTQSGDWVAIFGNGYNGADGVARLYVANLSTGALIKEISTGVGSSNGLGGIRLVRDANQRIVGAYAGDLKGNLWKFDLSNASSTSWGLGLSNTPLYQTTTTPIKPITAAPTVVAHPNGGYVVAFGTGKFFESTDVADTNNQSLYGVWDSVAFGATVTPSGVTQTDRGNLVQQTISTALAGTTTITNTDLSTSTVALNYYSVSRNAIDWTTKRGWYIDLPNTGQRVIYPLETLVGKFAAVDTMSPSNISLVACEAAGSGRAWNYIIDMVTGGGPTESIFDSNGGIATTTLVSGYENAADGRTRYIKNTTSSTSTKIYFTPLSTQQQPGFGISCTLTNTCASTSNVKRTWRQLFVR